ncbi:MAG: TetR family transcriptional regulator [Subtercola sp.]|nr:TetR family transcriptional regulator [Subtercola sp.]
MPAGARAVAPAGPGAGGPAVPAERAEPARRRRGQELEDALLEAAWLQLVDAGYGSFTIDAVADRAGTSRPVLYRRWPDRESLALAAIRHAFEQAERPDFDTGSLRGDLVAYLSYANDTRLEFAAVVSAQLGSFYRDTGTSMADLRTFLLGDRSGSVMDAILDRAAARGEVDLARITPRIAAVPFDLFRLEALMTMKPVPHSAMLEIVDDIFLPLVLLPLPLPLPPA